MSSYKVGTSDAFMEQITDQDLFKTYLVSSDTISANARNKLAVRNNTDIFYAYKNQVRCGTTTSGTVGFKLLDLCKCDFEIQALTINSLGTLLALVGTNDVIVVSIPTSLTSNKILLPVFEYVIHGINKPIVKVEWQEVAATDSSLVILADNVIKCYDISLSCFVPQLIVDLKDQGVKDKATSITFGSHKNLIGALTLYVSTEGGDIYALYPFISKYTKIASCEEALDEAITEAKSAIEIVENKFPFVSITETLDSPLKKKALFQYEFFVGLKKQLTSRGFLQTEVRNLGSNEPTELFVINHSLREAFIPSLQGPLYSGSNILDISSINSNKKASILVAVSSESKNTVITTFSQLTPLFMAGTDIEEIIVPTLAPSIKKEKKRGYVKPKSGFGYIDLSEQEEEVNKEEDDKEELAVKLLTSESEFIKALTRLNILSKDVLTASPKNTYVTALDETTFALPLEDKLLKVDTSKWVNTFVTAITWGKKEIDNNLLSEYETIGSLRNGLVGIINVKDVNTKTGDYVVYLEPPQLPNNLTVKRMTKDEVISPENINDSASKITPTNTKSLLLNEPIEIIVEEIASDNKIPHLKPKNNRAGGRIESNWQTLDDVNNLSEDTLKQVAKFTASTLKLKLRLETQMDEFKYQVQTLRTARNNVDIDEDVLNTRIAAATKRQDEIQKRILDMKDKIFIGIQKTQSMKSLPLSIAEKAWIKEINAIVTDLQDESVGSLTANAKELETQAAFLINEFENNKEESLAENSLQYKKLRHRIIWLRERLDEKGTMIQAINCKLKNSFGNLAITE